MNIRQERILRAIVETFLKSASPIGSQFLFETYDFDVSPATIRNDMSSLEEEGFISQPHTSAGRIPTASAYRAFVDRLNIDARTSQRAQKDITQAYKSYHLRKFKERLYDLVAILAEVTGNISFATLPDKERIFYIGISRALKQPEFADSPEKASEVIEVLENELYEILQNTELDDDVFVSIGEENIIRAMHSCSMLALRYHYRGYTGVMGVLGPTRIDYPYDIAALKEVVRMLA